MSDLSGFEDRRRLQRVPGSPQVPAQATRAGVGQTQLTPEILNRPAEFVPLERLRFSTFRFPQFGAQFLDAPQGQDPAAGPVGAQLRGVAALRGAGQRGDGGDRLGPGRGPGNVDPNDPFGTEFGRSLSEALGLAENVPGLGQIAGLARGFVDLALQDAQARQDSFTEGLIEGTAPVDTTSGITMSRRGDRGEEGSNIGQTEGAPGASVGEGGGLSQSDPDPGAFSDRGDAGTGAGGGGDAGSGGGGGGGESGGVGCFVAGTLVTMGNRTMKPIEEIEVGDVVLSFDAKGTLVPAKVVNVFPSTAKETLRVTLQDGRSFECTDRHPFLRPNGNFDPIGDLDAGANLVTQMGEPAPIETIEVIDREDGAPLDVYNFTVAGTHTYIASGLRVHNIKDAGGMVGRLAEGHKLAPMRGVPSGPPVFTMDAGGQMPRMSMPTPMPMNPMMSRMTMDAGGMMPADSMAMARPMNPMMGRPTMDAGGMMRGYSMSPMASAHPLAPTFDAGGMMMGRTMGEMATPNPMRPTFDSGGQMMPGRPEPVGHLDAGGMMQRQAMAKTPYDAGGMMRRTYDNGGMIGDNSSRIDQSRMQVDAPRFDSGGAVNSAVAGNPGAGPVLTADAGMRMPPTGAVNPMPVSVAGTTPRPDNGLAPPGDGRMTASIDGSGRPDVNVQSGEFVMSRAATNMIGPENLRLMNDQAMHVMGSDDMNGNIFPRQGAEMAGQGAGIPPLERTQPLTPFDQQVLAMNMTPELGSTLMKIVPMELRPLIMQAVNAGPGGAPAPGGAPQPPGAAPSPLPGGPPPGAGTGLDAALPGLPPNPQGPPLLPAPNTGPTPAGGGTAALRNVLG